MTIAALLDDLRTRGVRLWAEAGSLRYRAPAGVITESLKAALSARKEELVKALQAPESDRLAPAHQALREAADAVAARWNALPPDRRPDLDPAEDERLEEELNRAFRARDPEAALRAVRAWQEAWERLLAARYQSPRPAVPRTRKWLEVVEEGMRRMRKAERWPKPRAIEVGAESPLVLGPPGNRVDLRLPGEEQRRVDQAWLNRRLAELAKWDHERAEEEKRKRRKEQTELEVGDPPGGPPLVDGNSMPPPDQPPPDACPQPVQESPL